MNDHSYKNAFLLAVLASVALGGVLTYVLWEQRSPAAEATSIVAAKGPNASPSMPMKSTPAPDAAPATLSPVQLSPQRLQSIGVTTATVERKSITNEMRVPGNVDVNERNISYLQTRFSGWIQKVFANATYQYVRKGQPMFTIYSPELVSTEQEYVLAKKNQSAFNNDGHGTAAKESDWLVTAAADRLNQFGVPASEIQRLEKTGTVQHDITIDSPVSGYITEFNALPNQFTETGTKLYTIADLSSVWVYANVFQNEVGQLRPGIPAQVTVDTYPGRIFRGRIEEILPHVDPTTRTVRVRLVFSNPGLALKPGMFVNVSMSIPLGRQLVIPASGFLQSGTREIAFIDHGNGYLEPREIQIGTRLDDHVVVLKGLQAGDKIVSSANFLVDSEAQLQAAIGSFAPSPSGASEANSVNSLPGAVSMEFSSTPSPPQQGSNKLRVRLTGAGKTPVSGAQVTVTFYMPAMPAMGMAAIKKTASLADRGHGTYEGQLDLPSGGSYQVTIVATQGSQTIATKQFSINATGGM